MSLSRNYTEKDIESIIEKVIDDFEATLFVKEIQVIYKYEDFTENWIEFVLVVNHVSEVNYQKKEEFKNVIFRYNFLTKELFGITLKKFKFTPES